MNGDNEKRRLDDGISRSTSVLEKMAAVGSPLPAMGRWILTPTKQAERRRARDRKIKRVLICLRHVLFFASCILPGDFAIGDGHGPEASISFPLTGNEFLDIVMACLLVILSFPLSLGFLCARDSESTGELIRDGGGAADQPDGWRHALFWAPKYSLLEFCRHIEVN
ncbi:hypothetical protein [Methylovirgula sp. 4M-Z18]|uniref:hypothetical protein n=1 Tax=Methylovirgula sp. 4M-Z18 TaxID=2293567 RepID=UPI0011C0646F|nr:hypothetical protein [Methylovirgula sp. 4M-Z18]